MGFFFFWMTGQKYMTQNYSIFFFFCLSQDIYGFAFGANVFLKAHFLYQKINKSLKSMDEFTSVCKLEISSMKCVNAQKNQKKPRHLLMKTM